MHPDHSENPCACWHFRTARAALSPARNARPIDAPRNAD
ncbi:hypothetical protein PY32053_02034 [Paracoccus yeei]|uniref:Uncharacterized protein n=1 Tax=Paracoccus yeei TaxID=147645 RepID=A0A386UMS5_9RHOB|nr:hypothetical protein PY32053_02034 [Paracoccus yeei]